MKYFFKSLGFGRYFIFVIFPRGTQFCGAVFGLLSPKKKSILVPLKRTWGTLDSGIAVQSYTGIQMWISCTL